MTADLEEQEDELLALQSIFSTDEFVRDEPKSAGEIRVGVELPAGFTVALREGEVLNQFEISFLPPLLLLFELPEDYPSSSPPSFTLTCSWLTHTQLSALSAQLSDLYQDTGGAVVLFTWVQFLKEDALKFLDIATLLELPDDEHSTQNSLHAALSKPENNQHTPESGPAEDQTAQDSDVRETEEALQISEFEADDQNDPSSEPPPVTQADEISPSEQGAASLPIHPAESPQNKVQNLTPSQALLSQILNYDAVEQQKRFATTVFDCGVCFMSLLGSDCMQLPECGHIFCKACLSQLFKLQVTEGNVRSVTCPEADCDAAPTPAQVKSLVGEKLFSRYDRLLLQNTLDCMPDVVYCPRRLCGSAVIQEKSSNAAMCPVCNFAFCVKCKKPYRGTECCEVKKMTVMKKTETNTGVDLPQSQDVVYCPRRLCGSAVIPEKSSTEAMCSVCNFSFCVKCKWKHRRGKCRKGEEEMVIKKTETNTEIDLPQFQDVVYCPRPSCGSAVIPGNSSFAVKCSVCNFNFCVKCKKKYHGTESCEGEEKMVIKKTETNTGVELPQSHEGLKALWKDYTRGGKEKRKLLESTYGRRVLRDKLEDWLSEHWITFNSKWCPTCFSRIEKNSGCNAMTCSHCGQRFCWMCLAKLSLSCPGEHFAFGDSCSLYYEYD